MIGSLGSHLFHPGSITAGGRRGATGAHRRVVSNPGYCSKHIIIMVLGYKMFKAPVQLFLSKNKCLSKPTQTSCLNKSFVLK